MLATDPGTAQNGYAVVCPAFFFPAHSATIYTLPFTLAVDVSSGPTLNTIISGVHHPLVS
jgi:hypothetical protein